MRFLSRQVSFESKRGKAASFHLGYGGANGAAPRLEIEGSRAEYHHAGGVIEWFENREAGIEHGLTLHSRPTTPAGTDKLLVEVALDGMTARTEGSEGDLVFDSPQGIPSFRYSGLKVSDADGYLLAASMSPSARGITFTVEDQDASYPVTIDPLITTLEQEIGPEITGKGGPRNAFGTAIAIDGDLAAVGVPRDDVLGKGLRGSVYLFARQNGVWSQSGLLQPQEYFTQDFGVSVALEGNMLLVGAPGTSPFGLSKTGRVYVFTLAEGTWTRTAILTASDPQEDARFGYSVALSGNRALIGAPGPAEDVFGSPPTPSPGAAYVINRFSFGWDSPTKLTAPGGGMNGDMMGYSVALEGDHAFIGAPGVDASQLHHEGSVHVFTGFQGTWNPARILRASGTYAHAAFGCAVAIDGSTLVVGAEGSSPIHVSQDDQNGSAYVFTGSADTWTLQEKFRSSNPADARFGCAVAIDGDTIVAGASSRFPQEPYPNGSAHVFTRSGQVWTERARFDSEAGQGGGKFGAAVAINGGTLMVGAPEENTSAANRAGRVHTFAGAGSNWSAEEVLGGNDEGDGFEFGNSVAIQGDRAVVGAPYDTTILGTQAGCAYVFKREQGVWNFEERLDAGLVENSGFGRSVALDDERILVSAADYACVFKLAGDSWSLEDNLLPNAAAGFVGSSAALDGDLAVFGIPVIDPFSDDTRGRAWVFKREGGEWLQAAELVAAGGADDDLFGAAVAIEGTTVLVGRPGIGAGSVHVFTPINGTWGERAKLQATDGATDDYFGRAVALKAGTALIGAPNADVSTVFDAGSAYLFSGDGAIWRQTVRLRSATPTESASFGGAVALGRNHALIGAPAYASMTFSFPQGRGSAELFARTANGWERTAVLSSGAVSSDTTDGFGQSVAIDGGTALIGCSHKDFNDLPHDDRSADQGSVFIYRLASEEASFIGAFDKDGDRELSVEEWLEVFAQVPKKDTTFPLIDSDASGKLSIDELQAGRSNKKLAKTLGLWLERCAVLAELDSDGDKRVTRQEIGMMWKPGTAAKAIDSFWSRMGGGSGMELKAWIKTKAIPSIPGYAVAKAMRTQRLEVAAAIDADEDEQINREEFAALFKTGTTAAKIDVAWIAATATPKGGVAPGSIPIPEFVEAAKLPKLP